MGDHQPATTLLLRSNLPYLYNSWSLNNRLRLKNAQLSKRQQSSCCIAFYSLCICVSAGVMIIVIYRFTDECSSTTNIQQFFTECFRHWLFFLASSISLLACSGFIFGACRYFRSQRLNYLYEQECISTLESTNRLLLPRTTTSHHYGSPTLLTNGTSIVPSRYRDDEHSSITIISSLTNISPQRRMPPFDYDELPRESTPISISMSPDRTRFFPSSTSTLSSPPPQPFISVSARTSDLTAAINNSNKSKATLIFEDPSPRTSASHSTLNVWERH